MQLIDGKPIYTATDLVGFLACEHLTALERAALRGLVARPSRIDPELEIIRRRGLEHEARYLTELRDEGLRVVSIEPDAYDAMLVTDYARRSGHRTGHGRGADIIYQATFFDGLWRGRADFLRRVIRRNDEALGHLPLRGRRHKAGASRQVRAILQLCSYVELLTAMQGVQPEFMHVALEDRPAP